MSSFNDRWQQLAAAARRAPHDDTHVDLTALAERLAARGLAGHSTPAWPTTTWQGGWHGMAAAALLFAVCLVTASAFAPRPVVGEAFTLLASVPRMLPSTGFIPAPPRPPTLDLPATFTGIAAWFSPSSATASLESAP